MGPELEVPYSIAHQLSRLADLQGAGLEEVWGNLAKLRLPEGISLWVRLNRGFDVGHAHELFVDRAYGSSFSGLWWTSARRTGIRLSSLFSTGRSAWWRSSRTPSPSPSPRTT